MNGPTWHPRDQVIRKSFCPIELLCCTTGCDGRHLKTHKSSQAVCRNMFWHFAAALQVRGPDCSSGPDLQNNALCGTCPVFLCQAMKSQRRLMALQAPHMQESWATHEGSCSVLQPDERGIGSCNCEGNCCIRNGCVHCRRAAFFGRAREAALVQSTDLRRRLEGSRPPNWSRRPRGPAPLGFVPRI